MGFFKLGSMTIGSIFKKKETLQYPAQTKEPYPGQKGTIKNARVSDCTLCGVCEKKCPCKAISVDREQRKWSINHLLCIQCGYCTQSCPKKCLEMDGSRPGITAVKEDEVFDIPETPKKEEKEDKEK